MIELTYKQTLAYNYWRDDVTKELIFGGGLGSGKSYWAAFCIIENCLKMPGTQWLIARKELKELMGSTFKSFMKVLADQNIPPDAYSFNWAKSEFTFYNGSMILWKDLEQSPSDPTFRNMGSYEFSGAFIDEAGEISYTAWNIVRTRIRYRLTEFCNYCYHETKNSKPIEFNIINKPKKWLCANCGKETKGLVAKIIGTCNPEKNWLYEHFYAPSRDSTLQPGRVFVQALAYDNPYLPEDYVKGLETLDQASRERLLYGNWDYDDSPTILCPFPKIVDCFDSKHLDKDESRIRISADIAMQGRDLFVVCVWFGDVVEIAIAKKKATGPEIERDIQELSKKYGVPHSDIVTDSDGLGAFLEGYLKNIRTFHGGGRAIHPLEYNNIKSECAFKLAERINKGRLKIICTPEQRKIITSELNTLRQRSVDDDEKRKAIIRKEDMKKMLQHSPDFLDALIMGCWFDLAKQLTWAIV